MRGAPLIACLGALAALNACDDMGVQPKQTTYAPAASPATTPSGTIEFQAREVKPPPVTLALLERGHERYHVFCAPCHSELGDGHGMIIARGFPVPPSLLTEAPTPTKIYQAISDGDGIMYSFADRIVPEDRWAIAAYVAALERAASPPP